MIKPQTHLTPQLLGPPAGHLFAAADLMNQTLIEHLNPGAWTARPPGGVRTIAAIFTHMHNVRCKWVRLSAPHLQVPSQLHRARCTPDQARAALSESAARCVDLIAESLSETPAVHTFRRDAWAAPWPVGVEMLCYMLTHEAHHRGQVCLLAHQLGHPLPSQATGPLWSWKQRL